MESLIDNTKVSASFVTAKYFRGEKVHGLGIETDFSNELNVPFLNLPVKLKANKYTPLLPHKEEEKKIEVGESVKNDDGEDEYRAPLKEHTRTGSATIGFNEVVAKDEYGTLLDDEGEPIIAGYKYNLGFKTYNAYPEVDANGRVEKKYESVADSFLGLDGKITDFNRKSIVKDRDAVVISGKDLIELFGHKLSLMVEQRLRANEKADTRIEVDIGNVLVGLEIDLKNLGDTDLSAIKDIQVKGEQKDGNRFILNLRDSKKGGKGAKAGVVLKSRPLISTEGYDLD